jgi:hypothetical protein
MMAKKPPSPRGRICCSFIPSQIEAWLGAHASASVTGPLANDSNRPVSSEEMLDALQRGAFEYFL